jgi:alginate O-acetyltransferase complex protein AlgI
MVFSSITFFIFFAIVLTIMASTKIKWFSKPIISHIALLVASYVFYGWWDWRFCFLMFFLTVVAYISAKQTEKHPKSKLFIILGVVVPLAVLGVFKYFNFFVSSFVKAFGLRGTGSLNIILPVRISFYTFQSLSYTIDVYRKKNWCGK